MSLEIQRTALHRAILDLDLNDDDQGKAAATAAIQRDWVEAKRLIENWWGAYKAWEGTDSFNQAVADRRMTMRSWDGDKIAFGDLVNKTGPSNIADEKRFYASSADRQPAAARADGMSHKDKFAAIANPTPPQFGWSKKNPEPEVVYGRPVRGISASAFMTPANFTTREKKYQLGLHDTSVKLLIPGGGLLNPGNLSFKDQSHNQAAKKAYFCFLPISMPEDQYVIYKLIRYAKALKTEVPALDTLIRGYRTEMTRVKLAHGYDMGTGYIAVQTNNDKIPYKVSYSIGSYVKERGEGGQLGKADIPVDSEIIRKRRQAYFKQNADVVRLGNEIVIAMREHAGQFPVYAYSAGGPDLTVFSINGKTMVPDNIKRISAQGVANF